MYTAVLMLAMTTGTETVDFGRRGGRCGGCYATCAGAYSGGGCWGSGGGCWGAGGVYRAGYYNGFNAPRYAYGPSMYTFPNGEIRQSFYLDPNQRNVMVRVLVPDPDAEIWFDNAATTQRGFDRSFQSPPLENGAYSYTIKARWMENGQPVNQERRVELQAGQGTTVDFRVKMGEKVPTPKTPPNGK